MNVTFGLNFIISKDLDRECFLPPLILITTFCFDAFYSKLKCQIFKDGRVGTHRGREK